METINGVTVLFDVKPIEEKDGFVGSFRATKKTVTCTAGCLDEDENPLPPEHSHVEYEPINRVAQLDIYVESGRAIHAFGVDGKKNVIPRRDLARDEEPAREGKHYRANVQIKTSLENVLHTEYPDNNIRLLEVLSEGRFRIWEVALVSQGGDFFVTVQKTYEAYCYRDGEKFACPQFAKWPQLVAFLEKLFEGKVDELPLVASYQPEPKTSTEGLAPSTGKVLWFNFAQGVGAIITSKGTARVHWTQVAKRGRRAYLLPGESVRYSSLKAPQNTKLRSSSFAKEAVRVKAL